MSDRSATSPMRVLICGARGSRPAPGPEFIRYGGNTSCVAVGHGEETYQLVLDAGSGLVNLARALGGAPFQGTIALSHLHWDHTRGIPFFSAGDRVDARVHLLMPDQGDPLAVLSRGMSPPHFPITPSELRGDWRFSGLEPGEHRVEGFTLTALEVPHKGGRTYGYRVSNGLASLAYIPDHAAIGVDRHAGAVLELCRDVDLLIHDAQFTAEEHPQVAHFGHSTIESATSLARASRAWQLLLFHHDPARTDDELDALAATHAGSANPMIIVAVEGMEIALQPGLRGPT